MVIEVSDILIWKSDRILSLRRRLGWSQAELSRRLGVKVDAIQMWETGAGSPGIESMNELSSLESHVESYSSTISALPMAEVVLKEQNLNQILRKDLHRFTGKS